MQGKGGTPPSCQQYSCFTLRSNLTHKPTKEWLSQSLCACSLPARGTRLPILNRLAVDSGSDDALAI